MSAIYIRRGAYRVTHMGQSVTVMAKHPCDALAIAARIFGIGESEKEVA